jgi:hypothetical protein
MASSSRLPSTAALLLWMAVCCCALPAWASDRASHGYALIFGTVWDGARPVYGVHVKLRRAGEKKFRWEATSDHRGEFGIRVPAGKGDYILVAELKRKGEPDAEKSIHIDGDERVDLGFHLDQE